MRDISSPEAANAYLPQFAREFNARFAVAPRIVEDAHRPLAEGFDLRRSLTLIERRVLSKNLTLSDTARTYRIETPRPAYTRRGAQVEVREARDGALTVEYQGKPLAFSLYSERVQEPTPITPAKLLDARLVQSTPTQHPTLQAYHPSATHPWRLDTFGKAARLKASRR